jgi:signal transduction histidine kinase
MRIHKSRADSDVDLHLGLLPIKASLVSKITVFRVLQESLSNAFRHGGDISPEVRIYIDGENLRLEVTDHGPGMTESDYKGVGMHLGLEVMRERVELLGGEIVIRNVEPSGTIVIADIPFLEETNNDEG